MKKMANKENDQLRPKLRKSIICIEYYDKSKEYVCDKINTQM